MKYFLDTEFIEGFKKPISWLPTIGKFNKPYHSIQLISIGIKAEDGREYYAISNEFNPKDADKWVHENVLDPLEAEMFQKLPVHAKSHYSFSFKKLLQIFGKSNKQIAEEIFNFCSQDEVTIEKAALYKVKFPEPEFYAYYADYDWVVFCSLFGTMMDLPNGFPMYCIDLKQMFDDVAPKFFDRRFNGYTAQDKTRHPLAEKFDFVKKLNSYPKIENEHNALADAKWNHELYKFLKKL